GHGEIQLVDAFLAYGKLPAVGPIAALDAIELHGLQWPAGRMHLERDRGQSERLELGVCELCLHVYRVARHVLVAIGRENAAGRIAPQTSLRDLANQLGVERLEVAVAQRTEPPHLAAAHVKHHARADALASEVDRRL